MRAYRIVGALGRALISVGVLILLFVAYQLWGTGIREARAQADLKEDFRAALEAAAGGDAGDVGDTGGTDTDGDGDGDGETDDPVVGAAAPPPAPEGEAVAIIRIPRIDVEKAVVEGVGVADLKKGPGHYPGTPLPGQPGNAAIAGHRTTYGAPFYELDELEPGDEVLVTTHQGEFRYVVADRLVVRPDQVEVLDPTDEPRLTLTTCHPRFSARQRLVVVADLAQPPAPGTTTTTTEPDAEIGDPDAVDAPPPSTPVAFEGAGLSGDPAARGPALLWGALAAAVWLATWLLARRWRAWHAYALGAPVFLAVLFVFFENVARLFPANI